MQSRKITRELAAAVDGVVISEVLGVAKPDPAIYQTAAAAVRAELIPEAWCIGDLPETDIQGAVNVGIRSAWIRRNDPWDATLPFRPTLEATDFADAVRQILSFPGPTSA